MVNLHSDLPFLIEKMKIKNSISFYAICMKKRICCSYKSLKKTLNHGPILKNTKLIQFNQEALLKRNIDMNTELRAEVKNVF